MVKNQSANAGDAGSIPEWRRSPGGANGNALQYSCLENSMYRGAWLATVHGVAKSRAQLCMNIHQQVLNIYVLIKLCREV